MSLTLPLNVAESQLEVRQTAIHTRVDAGWKELSNLDKVWIWLKTGADYSSQTLVEIDSCVKAKKAYEAAVAKERAQNPNMPQASLTQVEIDNSFLLRMMRAWESFIYP